MMYDNLDQVIADTEEVIALLTDTTDIQKKIDEQTAEKEISYNLGQEILERNKMAPMDQDEFHTKYDAYMERNKKAIDSITQFKKEIEIRNGKKEKMEDFLNLLKSNGHLLEEWDDSVWQLIVEKATVRRDYTIEFQLYNGTTFIG